MSVFELHTLIDFSAYFGSVEMERLRLQIWLLKQNGYYRKSVKLKDVFKLPFEDIKPKTKADKKMIDWFERYRKQCIDEHEKKENT